MTAGAPTIVKVGGSVLRTAADYARLASILARRLQHTPTWVVVSAAQGVTDRLGTLGPDGVDELLTWHEAFAGEPVPPWLAEDLNHGLAQATVGRPGALRSWGERASAFALAARLHGAGVYAPVVELSARSRPPRAHVAIVPGFYLRDRHGTARTLPRGGSDISAVLVARMLSANEVRLWKEGGGIRGEGGQIVKEVDARTLLDRIGTTIRPIHPAAVRIARHCGIDLVFEELGGTGASTRVRAVSTTAFVAAR